MPVRLSDGGVLGPETSDERLMLAFKAGDARAFEELVQRHRTPVFNFILRFTGHRARAEDVLQETWLKVVRSAGEYEPKASSRPGFTRSRGTSAWTARAKRATARPPPWRPPRAMGPAVTRAGRWARRLPDTGASPERGAYNARLRPLLERALASLPEEQREVFLLREYSGIAFKEIAEVTGVSENTVKSRMRYALEGLRTAAGGAGRGRRSRRGRKDGGGMKPQSLHAHEDRLLDFAYGELPPPRPRPWSPTSRAAPVQRAARRASAACAPSWRSCAMEPAPDAGLESLLAYAQQAARNAAAGPAPKPTWWRRWLVPVMGVAAVCAFGVVSVTVNKNTAALKEEIEAQSAQAKNAEAAAPASPAPSPDESYREPPKTRAPVALPPAASQKAAPQAQMAPPTTVAGGHRRSGVRARSGQGARHRAGHHPAAAGSGREAGHRLDGEGEPRRKKPFVAGTKGSRSEWSNAGAGLGFADTRMCQGRRVTRARPTRRLPPRRRPEELRLRSPRRDDPAGAFAKPKPILRRPAAGRRPLGAAAPAAVHARPGPGRPGRRRHPRDGPVAESDALCSSTSPRGSLRV